MWKGEVGCVCVCVFRWEWGELGKGYVLFWCLRGVKFECYEGEDIFFGVYVDYFLVFG